MTEEVVALTERDGEANEPEREHAATEVHEVLHHDVADVLAARESGLDKGEAGLHEDHQDGREEDPDVVEDHLHVCRGAALGERGRRAYADRTKCDHRHHQEFEFHVQFPSCREQDPQARKSRAAIPRLTKGQPTDGRLPPRLVQVSGQRQVAEGRARGF